MPVFRKAEKPPVVPKKATQKQKSARIDWCVNFLQISLQAE